ncbi:putative zinc finger protein 2 [Trypanosoma cruzi]|uniref:Zinc finger protein 2, putative n=2 Tax=Trypanosoma cruzi TaxID=5693 RepID=Q4CLW6_TRYCC|nr:zinc finger protein 2, putative [Trypanosoma cruzi]EAN81267.1 zinc finger protein 2, putative [Trypanosoma cruzi]PWV18770.1 putative zinc finger protein 2 [Trypanosoma cruzi]RNC41985.1 zinc finger protein 2 [Trypanosoma cruzi]|eukprot:XP_802713.1 zinc finger protein 2 [Trypanosoma cruzi strain CL Brener]
MSYPNRYGRGMAAPYGTVQLPVGWQMAYSAEGDPYYIDHNTRTTHWQIPAEVLQRMNQGQVYRGRVRRGIDRTKLKTKMCMNIQRGGVCNWGDNCAFAHNSEELTAVPHGGNQRGGDGNPYRMRGPANNNSNNNLTNNHSMNNGNSAPNAAELKQPKKQEQQPQQQGIPAPQQAMPAQTQ